MEADLEKGTTSLRKYWQLPESEGPGMNFRDAVHHLRELVDDAVSLRMVSDVPVGTFLSGGLDSSVIASAIKDRKDVTHYVAVKRRSDLRAEGTTSDAYYAHLLRDEWGLRVEDIPIGLESLDTGMLDRVIQYSDDLIADGSQVPAWLISKGASERSKVLLSGMGADELFFGYNWHMLTWLDRRMRRLPAFLGRGLAMWFAGLSQGKGYFKAYRRYLHKLGKYYNEPSYRYGFYALVGDVENAFSLDPGSHGNTLDLIRGQFPQGIPVYDALMRFDLNHSWEELLQRPSG
jgi:Asparagine synthase (glutamine-hydrolyzing)